MTTEADAAATWELAAASEGWGARGGCGASLLLPFAAGDVPGGLVGLAEASDAAGAVWTVGGASGTGIGAMSAEAMAAVVLPGRTVRGSAWLIRMRPESGGTGGAGGTNPQAERRQAAENTAAK